MDYFTLMGRPCGPVFEVKSWYAAAGFIPAVHGVTLDGKFRTSVRVVDVNFFSFPAEAPRIPTQVV